MNQILAIALGGGLGAVLRYGVGVFATPLFSASFPFPTLIINALGSFIIGYCAAKLPIDANSARAFIMTGILGGFTTFSTFSLETLKLWHDGQKLEAGAYIVASLVLCLLGVMLGNYLGDYLSYNRD